MWERKFQGHSFEWKNLLGYVCYQDNIWHWSVNSKLGTLIDQGIEQKQDDAMSMVETTMTKYYSNRVTPLIHRV